MTPDEHALLGVAPGVENLYLANSSSGHGVMHSPATGRAVSDLILDGRTDAFDLAPLHLDRFAAGRLIEETSLL